MANNQRSLVRRMLPTAHKKLLNKNIEPMLQKLSGDVLIIGAGQEAYHELVPNASSLLRTDIEGYPGIDQIVDAHKLPFKDGRFTSIVAMEVFEHLRNPNQATQEIHRVLAEDGEVVLSVPFLFRVHGDPYDYHRFTEWALIELFEEFEEVHVFAYGNRSHVISDILTTASRPLVAFRIFNHFLALKPFATPSQDCPSGYIIKLVK